MKVRRSERKNLIYYPLVINQEKDETIGNLIDITEKGLKIMSESAIEVNKIYHLKIDLPAEISGTQIIHAVAKCVWSNKGLNPDFFEAGFMFVDNNQKRSKIIENVISEFCFQNDVQLS